MIRNPLLRVIRDTHQGWAGVFALVTLAASVVAHAALVDLGNGLINDPDDNLSWVGDANLFHTQATLDANLVATIVSDWTLAMPNPTQSGPYVLTSADF